MTTSPLLLSLCLLIAPLAQAAETPPADVHHPAGAQRQADVARRGAEVMPFDLAKTTHVFTKTANGGTQRVVAKDAADAGQVRAVRRHLREIEGQFRQGDFSAPEQIHGASMPGLEDLRTAPRGAVAIRYADVPGGGLLTYSSRDTKLVSALHRWFDAQLSDHGADAMEGHAQMHGDRPMHDGKPMHAR